VETEAYAGLDDRASHASRGRTPRTAIMFGAPGFAYIYLVYGMHHCLNVVVDRCGYPAAVLVRALEPLDGVDLSPSGPGRLCRALSIDRRYNGADLTSGPLFLAPGSRASERVVAARRVGVEYAGEWARKPRRFYLAGNPWVSRPTALPGLRRARRAAPVRG
jgi:DNA-3-methyladenine glycosylase